HVDGNLVGDLLVQGSLPTPTAGIDVEGDLGPDGMIQIPGLVAGQISIGGDCEGTIWLRVVHESGYIVVKGSVTGAIVFYPLTAYLRGTLDIGGDLLGTILFYWPPGGIYGGRIHIRGSLRNNAPGHEISANYLLDNGAIAIDYDGWDPGDVWETGATVSIADTVYYGNTPVVPIWEIQRWRGDMNNDGGVNAADNENDLFLTAMHYPEQYAELFPGLEGSRVYHGDCNCDGEFDELDIDPFTFL
ncbi:MAG: hypothetical protein ACE5I3_08690, partial [Phycisphaerae bacterium]